MTLLLVAASLAFAFCATSTALFFVMRQQHATRLLAFQQCRENQRHLARLSETLAGPDLARQSSTLHARIVATAQNATSTRCAILYLPDDAGYPRPVHVAGLPPCLGPAPRPAPDRAPRSRGLAAAFRAELPQPLPPELDAVLRENAARLVLLRNDDGESTALLAAPVPQNSTEPGLLLVTHPVQAGRQFDDTDAALLQSIATQAAAALQIQAAKKKAWLDADLARAAQNQRHLLTATPLPRTDRLDIAVTCRPLRPVGGDFYCVRQLPDGRVGAVVADVSGKGVQAALLMSACHAHLQYLLPLGHSPAAVLCRLNAAMADTVRPGHFITACCVLFDPAANTLSLARAGHEKPLLLLPPGAEEGAGDTASQTHGMPIGLVPSAEFDNALNQVSLPFPPGAVLTLFTDGLIEAVNPSGAAFGTKLAHATFREHSTGSAGAINAALLAALASFSQGAAPEDDLTLLTFKAQ